MSMPVSYQPWFFPAAVLGTALQRGASVILNSDAEGSYGASDLASGQQSEPTEVTAKGRCWP